MNIPWKLAMFAFSIGSAQAMESDRFEVLNRKGIPFSMREWFTGFAMAMAMVSCQEHRVSYGCGSKWKTDVGPQMLV